jgi:hypothetical protein
MKSVNEFNDRKRAIAFITLLWAIKIISSLCSRNVPVKCYVAFMLFIKQIKKLFIIHIYSCDLDSSHIKEVVVVWNICIKLTVDT